MNLINTYPMRLDTGDHEGLGELFKHGAVRRPDSLHEGAKAVKEMYDGVVFKYDGNPRTRHVITNTVLEIDAEKGHAEAWSYFQVFQQTPTLPLQVIVSGRYRDQFKKVDGKWVFAEKHIMPDYVGNADDHLSSRSPSTAKSQQPA